MQMPTEYLHFSETQTKTRSGADPRKATDQTLSFGNPRFTARTRSCCCFQDLFWKETRVHEQTRCTLLSSLRSRRLEVGRPRRPSGHKKKRAREKETREGRGSSLTPRVSPLRAPVLSFANYFQAPATQATFYLGVNHTTKNSDKSWFKANAMGVNKLNSLMKTMAENAGLDNSQLKNHSARKRMVQTLNDKDIPPCYIPRISLN